jgi:hypothetical protein
LDLLQQLQRTALPTKPDNSVLIPKTDSVPEKKAADPAMTTPTESFLMKTTHLVPSVY